MNGWRGRRAAIKTDYENTVKEEEAIPKMKRKKGDELGSRTGANEMRERGENN
jgi:hypothetical protein